MTKYITFLLMFPFVLIAQDSFPLTIASGNSLVMSQGATLNIAGMELTPDSEYVLDGDNTNQISLTNSPETVNNTQTMSKVFGFQQALTTFSGVVVFNYDESIMNDVSHNAALYIFDDTTSTWSEYPDQDSDDFTVTYGFDGTVPMSKLTAGAENNLSIDDNSNFGISVFPNPVSSNLSISGLESSTNYLYNILGQLVLTSNSKTINLSSLEKGLYFLIVEDTNKNQSNFKILKK